jgi:minor extracellular serine protease Vpr
VRLTIGNVLASVTSMTSSAASPGVVDIAFRIPATAPSGRQPLVVTAGSVAGAPTQVLIAGPAINGVLNGASFATDAKVAPGSLVALFGTDLADEDRFGVFPSPVLPGNGVVTIGGVSAPLFDVVASAGQINLMVPFETATTGSVPVVVTNSMGVSNTFQLAMAPAGPGIFRIADPGEPKRFNAAALLANTAWRAIPSSMAAAYGMAQNCRADRVNPAAICGEPALPGDHIQIYVTGLGRATVNGNPFGNTLRTGDIAPASGSPQYRTVETPRVTIGGIDAAVAFSGVAPGFAGLYQVNVMIPAGVPVGDDVPVVVEIGGASDTATIAIRRP